MLYDGVHAPTHFHECARGFLRNYRYEYANGYAYAHGYEQHHRAHAHEYVRECVYGYAVMLSYL